MSLNTEKIRQDFFVLSKKIKGQPIIYFDNACMTLKPKQVIDSMNDYYINYPACGERSQHALGKIVTEKVDWSRKVIANFIGAKNEKEIIITKNTTEGINIVANSFKIDKGKHVVISEKEHNSNLLPWLKLKTQGKISNLEFVKFSQENFDIDDFQKKVKNAGFVSVVWTSNMDGSSIPIEQVIKIAHENKVPILIDAAQAAPHKKMNVRKLDADFLSFSGHKMLGPTGMGALYVKSEFMKNMDGFVVGGGTVDDTTYNSVKWTTGPEKFEAGLQNYAGIIGMAHACEYLSKIGLDEIEKHEFMLNKKATDELNKIKGVEILGPKDAKNRSGIISFNIKGMDYHTIAIILNETKNIMIRSGRHCVHSWFNANNIDGSARASLYLYNTPQEIDVFVEEIKKLVDMTK